MRKLLTIEGKTPSCLLCGRRESELVFQRDGFDYKRCYRCGLVYLDHWRTGAQAVNQRFYGEQRSKCLREEGQWIRHERRTHRLLSRFEKRGLQGRLLEIGSAEGFFLHVASKRGWEVHGVEIEPEAARYGRNRWGIDIFCGPVQEAPWREASFEMVYMSNVLEHLLNPVDVLKNACRLLRPGGVLYVKTGNAASYSSRVLGPQWYYFDFLRLGHVAFYSPHNIRYALEQAGFAARNVRIHTSGIHAARRGPLPRRLLCSILNPWAHLTRQGDNLLVEVTR